jgi:hypothetical protein
MAFGIIRVANLKINSVGKTEIHNARLYQECGLPLPDNIHPEKDGHYGHNHYYTEGLGDEDSYQSGNLLKAVNQRIQEANLNPRSNSVVAIEFIISSSIELFPTGAF